MTPYPHQTELAKLAYSILAEHMIVYLAMEERTGKTLTAILVCEQSKLRNVLVITKKKALGGWQDTLKAFSHTVNYTVVNYHQAKKELDGDFDAVILDEAHNYVSSFPKPSAMWSDIGKLTRDKPIIYLSATPYAQGAQLLYHQFALSSWSPFKKWTTAYNWFRSFGIPDTIYLAGRQVESYKQARTEEVLLYCKHLFITKTRKELGFHHEPTDKVHYVTLGEKTRQVYNILTKHKIIELNGHELVCDTTMKLRTALHMLEGGVAKVADNYLVLGNTEKLDYIKATWPNQHELVIMYQYIAEKEKLEAAFPDALVLQATSFAEGVDLSHKKTLVIYSQDFSTARHSQRRARQANLLRTDDITVHFLLVKKAISEEVYKTVSVNKTNYIDSLYKETLL